MYIRLFYYVRAFILENCLKVNDPLIPHVFRREILIIQIIFKSAITVIAVVIVQAIQTAIILAVPLGPLLIIVVAVIVLCGKFRVSPVVTPVIILIIVGTRIIVGVIE